MPAAHGAGPPGPHCTDADVGSSVEGTRRDHAATREAWGVNPGAGPRLDAEPPPATVPWTPTWARTRVVTDAQKHVRPAVPSRRSEARMRCAPGPTAGCSERTVSRGLMARVRPHSVQHDPRQLGRVGGSHPAHTSSVLWPWLHLPEAHPSIGRQPWMLHPGADRAAPQLVTPCLWAHRLSREFAHVFIRLRRFTSRELAARASSEGQGVSHSPRSLGDQDSRPSGVGGCSPVTRVRGPPARQLQLGRPPPEPRC